MSIVMNAISRHFEWEADRFAVELQDKLEDEKMNDMGDRLGRALIALHVKNLSTVWVDWMYVLVSFKTFVRAQLTCGFIFFLEKVLGIPPFSSYLDGAFKRIGNLPSSTKEEDDLNPKATYIAGLRLINNPLQ